MRRWGAPVAMFALAACASFQSTGAPTDAGVEAAAPTGTSPTDYAAAVRADGPIAYWRLGEQPGATTAKDEMGAHDGMYDKACDLGAPGAVAGDTALSLDGKNCEVDVGPAFAFEGNATFSIEAWFKTAPADSHCCFHVFTHEDRANGNGSPTTGYALLVNHPDSMFAERIIGTQTPDVAIPAETFVHAVLTYDGSNMLLYLNGGLSTSHENDGASASSTVHAFIGSAGPGNNYFTGSIDEVAVYDKVLAAARISAHYQAAQH